MSRDIPHARGLERYLQKWNSGLRKPGDEASEQLHRENDHLYAAPIEEMNQATAMDK